MLEGSLRISGVDEGPISLAIFPLAQRKFPSGSDLHELHVVPGAGVARASERLRVCLLLFFCAQASCVGKSRESHTLSIERVRLRKSAKRDQTSNVKIDRQNTHRSYVQAPPPSAPRAAPARRGARRPRTFVFHVLLLSPSAFSGRKPPQLACFFSFPVGAGEEQFPDLGVLGGMGWRGLLFAFPAILYLVSLSV